jgi:ABC-type uncharacterized transport system permease subunit
LEALLGTTFPVFLGLTVVLIGGAAILTGQALANNWRAAWQVVLSCIGLGLADRFLVYALFGGELLSLTGFLIDTAVITAIGLVAYRVTRVRKVVSQYPWKYERDGIWSYRQKQAGSP